MPGFVKVAGVWQQVDVPNVKVAGVFEAVPDGWVKVAGVWERWHTPTGPPPLAPGQYILNATSQSIGDNSGFAEFDTTPYRGRITEIRCRVNWNVMGSSLSFVMNVAGRTSGNSYRSIANNFNEWDGRTIDHRIDTYDAASLTEFNSGAAIGFTYSRTSGVFMGTAISNTQLVLTIV